MDSGVRESVCSWCAPRRWRTSAHLSSRIASAYTGTEGGSKYGPGTTLLALPTSLHLIRMWSDGRSSSSDSSGEPFGDKKRRRSRRSKRNRHRSDDDRDADQPSQPLHFDRRAFAASNRPRARKRRTRTCTPRDTKNRLLLVLVVLLQTVVIIALRVGVRVTGAWMGRSRPAARRMEKPSPGRFRSACLRWPV